MSRWSATLLCLLLLSPVLSPAQDLVEPWRIDSDEPVEYDILTGQMIATNGVTVHYRGVVLSARRALLNQQTGQVEAEGNVLLEREGQLWTGDRLRYNFKTGHMSGEDFKTGDPPFFAQGDAIVADQKSDVYVLANGYVTTDDVAEPAYRIRTKSLVVVPGDYVEARNATLLLGNTPVFYFPYFRRTLKQHGNHWDATPGYRSVDGPFLLTSYNWYWDERLDGKVHIDGRVKRGVGFGPDFNWHLPTLGEGSLETYYIDDQDPGRDDQGNPIDPERYRVWLTHIANPATNLTVRGAFRYQSDAEVTRDFFESQYRDNVQPSTFVEVNKMWSNYSLDLLAQPRVNDFFETVERLPDIKLTGFRQQLGPTPLFYDNESTFGWYRRKFADNETNSFSAARADSFHQVTLPRTFFNWLNVTPRAGGRYTYYSEAEGSGATTSEEERWVFNTGAEVSTKASRVWAGARQDFFGIDGLRHILTPSANYVYVPDPHPGPDRLPQFDYVVPSTRLLPIDFPDFNAIDGVDSQNTIRFGLQNKLQTKRRGQIDNVVNWRLFMDWRLDPRDDQRTYSDAYSDMDLKPWHWLTLTSQLRYDVNDLTWREANHIITFTPSTRWSLSLGQRYLDDNDPLLGTTPGNNLFFGTLYYRLSDNWGFRVYQRYEAEDGILEEQDYTVYRDLRSWTAAFTLRVRDERDGPTDVTAAVTFSLKAYPRYALGDDINRPSLLIGN